MAKQVCEAEISETFTKHCCRMITGLEIQIGRVSAITNVCICRLLCSTLGMSLYPFGDLQWGTWVLAVGILCAATLKERLADRTRDASSE